MNYTSVAIHLGPKMSKISTLFWYLISLKKNIQKMFNMTHLLKGSYKCVVGYFTAANEKLAQPFLAEPLLVFCWYCPFLILRRVNRCLVHEWHRVPEQVEIQKIQVGWERKPRHMSSMHLFSDFWQKNTHSILSKQVLNTQYQGFICKWYILPLGALFEASIYRGSEWIILHYTLLNTGETGYSQLHSFHINSTPTNQSCYFLSYYVAIRKWY